MSKKVLYSSNGETPHPGLSANSSPTGGGPRFKTQKINDVVVQPLVVSQKGFGKFKSMELFSTPYPNIGIFSRKNSGKTTIIFTIICKSVGRNTVVHIFSSTVDKDPSWKAIVRWLEQKGIAVMKYTSLNTDVKGDSQLTDLITDESEEKKTERKAKSLSPEMLIVLDDLPTEELRHPSVYTLLKTNRHHKAQVIISSQNGLDIMPASRKQIDYWLLLGGLEGNMLETIWGAGSFPVSLNAFVGMYKQATSIRYRFLYASALDGTFRFNFNEKVLLTSTG